MATYLRQFALMGVIFSLVIIKFDTHKANSNSILLKDRTQKIDRVINRISNHKTSEIQKNCQSLHSKPDFLVVGGGGAPRYNYLNQNNSENNALILWQEDLLSVRRLSEIFDRFPQNRQIVTMMSQCYSGSFANFIYQKGMAENPIALQTRCGFFATISTQPSVGCTPEVNEADYRDYSSSFFAGLSGVNRVGKPVTSADYNQDERVSYSEAHAFAKIDEQTSDLPVSTSEVWLQRQATETELEGFLKQPITNLKNLARPEQKYVLDSLIKRFNFDDRKSYWENFNRQSSQQVATEEKQAYQVRLAMELVNIGKEKQIRASKDKDAIAILDRLLACETSSWK
jgi:hypothetical protein